MRARQLSFLPKPELAHGGDVREGRRKIARPLDPKRPLHLTLRSVRARGKWSFLKKGVKGRLHLLLLRIAEDNGVRIHRYANVGNHLHVLLSFPSRRAFQRFLRTFAGRAAVLVTGATKGRPVSRFWDKLAYSRVLSWGREFAAVGRYLAQNLFEGERIGEARAALRPVPS